MIKKIAITIINIYQIFISTILKSILSTSRFCRFDETCSEFTKRAITEHGFIKGTGMGLVRLAKCQPFYSPNKLNGNI